MDAIRRIGHLMDKKTNPRYVLDADIEKCFDRINHEFLEKSLIPLADRRT